jgi:DNA-binding transcriptional MocR family regulator
VPGRLTPELLSARISSASARTLASTVAQMIRDEDIPTGTTLPTVRELAAALRISPSTVSEAWSLLRERSLIDGRGKSGVHVVSPAELAPQDVSPGDATHDLRFVLPDADLLPPLDQALLFAASQPGLDEYDKAGIAPPLETAVRRIWPYECEALIAASGATDGLWLALRALSVPGDRVLLESPGSPPIVRIVNKLGLIPVELESDRHGPLPESLVRGIRADPVAFVYQPRAQVPTGRVTSVARIKQLAAIVRRSRCMAVEFDDIGDLSLVPDRSIGQHVPDRTTVVKSFEKAYGPDLRMSVVGGPAHFITGIHGQMRLERQWTSRILQVTLAWLLDDEAAQQGLRDARTIYQQRLGRLRDALTAVGMEVEAQEGMCLWLPVRSERAAEAHSAADGVLVYPGRHSFPTERDGFVRVATSRLTHGYDDVAHTLRASVDAS